MIPIFIAVGHSASGKSTLLNYSEQVFQNFGKFPEIITDRDLLSRAVALDQERGWEDIFQEGQDLRVSAHAVLHIDHTDPGLRVFTVRDGVLLNEVHRQMRDIVFGYQRPEGLLVEWTTGPNIGEFPYFPTGEEDLIQSGDFLVELFNSGRPREGNQIVIQAIDAPFSLRKEWNARRPDAMDEAAFANIFHDGGELTRELARGLPNRVVFSHYENDYDDPARFLDEIKTLSKVEITKLLEGRASHPERR
jgi:hypothetical protein